MCVIEIGDGESRIDGGCSTVFCVGECAAGGDDREVVDGREVDGAGDDCAGAWNAV